MSLILPTIDAIQEAIITHTKAIDFTGLMLPIEVREWQWMGTQFTYPNIRIDLTVDYNQERCNWHNISVDFYVTSQKSTSKECSQLAGIIANAYTPKTFLSNSLQFYGVLVQSMSKPKALGATSSESEWQTKVSIKAKVIQV